MALTFGAAVSDRVDHGSSASLDKTQASILTVIMWVMVTTITNNRSFYEKQAAGIGPLLRVQTSGGIHWNISTGATNSIADVVSGTIVVNEWACLAATYDRSDSQDVRVFKGTLASLIAECSYDSTSNSTDAWDDSSASLFIGNRSTANSAIEGRIAYVTELNRRLSLAELQDWQFRPRVLSGCVLFSVYGYNGTGTQPDWSGTSNAGTVTGATVGDHVPISFRRAGPLWVPYTVAAAGAQRRFLLTRF